MKTEWWEKKGISNPESAWFSADCPEENRWVLIFKEIHDCHLQILHDPFSYVFFSGSHYKEACPDIENSVM